MTDTALPRPALPMLAPLHRRPLLTAAIGLALLAVAALGVRWWTTARFLVETDNAYVRADVVTLSSRIAGIVSEVEVADNQWVKAGDLLARIDDRDYRMRVDQAEGAVAAAQAGITAAQARVASISAQTREQRSLVNASTAAVTAHDAEARFAQLAYHRQSTLQQQRITSTQDLQAAEAAARKSEAELAAARASLAATAAHQQVLAAERAAALAAVANAQATLRQAQAQLDAARLDLARTGLRAPVDGWIGERSVRTGQYADIGQPLLALVPAQVHVVANYKETQTQHMRPGQAVRIVIDAQPGVALTGRLDSLAPASGAEFALLPPDNATGNFTKIVQRVPVRIRLDPDQPQVAELRPGMSVETTVDTRTP